MSKTRHVKKNGNKSEIRQNLLAFFGLNDLDLGKVNSCTKKQMQALRQLLLSAINRGGYVIAEEDGKMITTFAINSYNYKLAKH